MGDAVCMQKSEVDWAAFFFSCWLIIENYVELLIQIHQDE